MTNSIDWPITICSICTAVFTGATAWMMFWFRLTDSKPTYNIRFTKKKEGRNGEAPTFPLELSLEVDNRSKETIQILEIKPKSPSDLKIDTCFHSVENRCPPSQDSLRVSVLVPSGNKIDHPFCISFSNSFLSKETVLIISLRIIQTSKPTKNKIKEVKVIIPRFIDKVSGFPEKFPM